MSDVNFITSRGSRPCNLFCRDRPDANVHISTDTYRQVSHRVRYSTCLFYPCSDACRVKDDVDRLQGCFYFY